MNTVLFFRCFINKEIEVEILSPHALPSYTYVIIGRGQIVESKTISTAIDDDGGAGANKSKYAYRFSFVPSFECAPRTKIIVYCIRNRSILSANTSVALFEDFQNFIDLDVSSNTAKPGQTVDIKIKSNLNAYIGLLGMDTSVLLLRGGNDLTSNDIWSELEFLHTRVKRRMDSKNFFQTSGSNYYNNWIDFSVSEGIKYIFYFKITKYLSN